MTDRRRIADHNVWAEGQYIHVDCFSPAHDMRKARRDDADCGIVLDAHHALALARHILDVLSESLHPILTGYGQFEDIRVYDSESSPPLVAEILKERE